MFILVHSKPRVTNSLLRTLRKSTKQSHLDHLHNNQENDLEHFKKHTVLGQHTNTKIADLDPLKNTHPISATTQKRILIQQSTRITLDTEDNLKSIQAKSYSINFDQSQTLSNLSSLKNSKLLRKTCQKKLKSQICFSEYIQRCSLLSNLNKLLNCIKRLVKAFNDWSVSSYHLKLSQTENSFSVMVPKQRIGCFLESIGCFGT